MAKASLNKSTGKQPVKTPGKGFGITVVDLKEEAMKPIRHLIVYQPSSACLKIS